MGGVTDRAATTEENATLTPREASILSTIACNPRLRPSSSVAYDRLVSGLESGLAREIASVLSGTVKGEDVSPQARETADSLREWYQTKLAQAKAYRIRKMKSGRSGRSRLSRRPAAG